MLTTALKVAMTLLVALTSVQTAYALSCVRHEPCLCDGHRRALIVEGVVVAQDGGLGVEVASVVVVRDLGDVPAVGETLPLPSEGFVGSLGQRILLPYVLPSIEALESVQGTPVLLDDDGAFHCWTGVDNVFSTDEAIATMASNDCEAALAERGIVIDGCPPFGTGEACAGTHGGPLTWVVALAALICLAVRRDDRVDAPRR